MLTPPAALCALLFASGGPVEKKQLQKLLEIKESELSVTLRALSDALKDTGLTLIETETEAELRTSAEAADLVKKLRTDEFSRDLGKGSLETLAVIAYQEGASRSEIDWVRGVNSSASVRTLLMRGLVEGREDPSDKRKIRYTLTTDALAHLGLARIEDLPRHEELTLKARAVVQAESESRENTAEA